MANAIGLVRCAATKRPWCTARTAVSNGTGASNAMAVRASSKMSPDTPMTPPKTQSPSRVNATATATSDMSMPTRTQKRCMGPNRRPWRSLVAATC